MLAVSGTFVWLLILVVFAVVFGIYCLADLLRAQSVKGLPKWAWVLVLLLSQPLGGILYLLFGRGDRR